MLTATVVQDGSTQSVRLPSDCHLSSNQVFVKRVGNALVLLPCDNPWQPLFDSLDMFTDDFMADREQPPQQHREGL